MVTSKNNLHLAEYKHSLSSLIHSSEQNSKPVLALMQAK